MLMWENNVDKQNLPILSVTVPENAGILRNMIDRATADELIQLTDNSLGLVDKPLWQGPYTVLRKALDGLQKRSDVLISAGYDEKHLKEVKKDLSILSDGTIHMGLGIEGDKLVSWMSKKQDCTAMSSAEAEYVALSASSIASHAPVTALPYQALLTSVSCSSKTQVENRYIEFVFVDWEYSIWTEMFTKAFRRKVLVSRRRIGMRWVDSANWRVKELNRKCMDKRVKRMKPSQNFKQKGRYICCQNNDDCDIDDDIMRQ
ncbi:hypothetical protein Tco_1043021 [Tanacetum coccineum]|uniref:Uncharacterized protein n=1 Tax=Tanacetum coccineum TaxID=301880 RepID=A0ABQ5GL05_9ASTR